VQCFILFEKIKEVCYNLAKIIYKKNKNNYKSYAYVYNLNCIKIYVTATDLRIILERILKKQHGEGVG
jgi:predicted transport protein